MQPDQTDDQTLTGRHARMLATLQRLSELGMMLAENAAEQALAPPSEPPSRRGGADPNLVFVRLAGAVRACIALEARLAAAPSPAAARDLTRHPADPRRHAISAYLHDALEDSPEPKTIRAALHDRLEIRIDDYLAKDPGLVRAGGEIALDICQELNIPYDLARMPDELLVPPGRTVPPGYEEYLATLDSQAPAPA